MSAMPVTGGALFALTLLAALGCGTRNVPGWTAWNHVRTAAALAAAAALTLALVAGPPPGHR